MGFYFHSTFVGSVQTGGFFCFLIFLYLYATIKTYIYVFYFHINILLSLEKLSQTSNPFKIAHIIASEYAALADELNNLSDEVVQKIGSPRGYTGGLLYSLGMAYSQPKTFYQEAEALLASPRALSKKEFLAKRLPSQFTKGVFSRYQGQISEEIDQKVDEEFATYLQLDKARKALYKETRKKIRDEEKIAALEQEVNGLKNKSNTGIDSQRYRSQAALYQSLRSVFLLLGHIRKMTFLSFVEPFFVDKIAENLSPDTLKNMVPIEYLFKFHFSRSYSEYIFMHNFFLHLKEANHPALRYKKFTGLFALFFLALLFLPLGFSLCVVLFFLSFHLSFFKGEYNIPLTGISGISMLLVLVLSVTTFNGDFYQRFYARHIASINRLMVWTPCDYIEREIMNSSLKSSVQENQAISRDSQKSDPQCLETNYFLGETCVK